MNEEIKEETSKSQENKDIVAIRKSARKEKKAFRSVARKEKKAIRKVARKENKAIRKVRRLRRLTKYRENPFRVKLVEEFTTFTKRQYVSSEGDRGVQNIIVNGNDEAIGESRFFVVKKYDPEQFTKIFINRVAMMWDMPKAATRVFSYILHKLPKQEDEIFVDQEEVLKFTQYSSSNSIHEGLRWLIANDFLAKSIKPLHYFINPTIFFNGDRVSFVDTIIKNSKDNPNQLDIFSGIPSGE